MKLETSKQILTMLDSLFDNALEGLPGCETAIELAESYLEEHSNTEEAIDSLIKWQTRKCSTTGFLTGLGGFLTIPVTVPTDLAVNYYIQLRMIAAIAHIRGYDIYSDKLKSFIYLALVGEASKDILKQIGIKVGHALTKKAIQSVSGKVITKINQAVGTRLLTKFGEKGIINLGKTIPLAGGLVGAIFDGYYCKKVGSAAKDVFAQKVIQSKRAA